MAVTNQELFNIFLANPNMSDAQIVSLMEKQGISPAQVSQTFGIPVNEVVSRASAVVPAGQSVNLGGTPVQSQYVIEGTGENQQIMLRPEAQQVQQEVQQVQQNSAYTAENVNKLASQILAQGTTSKWSGGLSPETSARYMADDLAKSGITDISQVGKGPDGIINKVTGEKLVSGYGERTKGNLWSGSYEGKGNTGFGVEFDDKGNPIFFTEGASSSTLKKDLLKLAAVGGAIYGLGGFEGLLSGGTGALGATEGLTLGELGLGTSDLAAATNVADVIGATEGGGLLTKTAADAAAFELANAGIAGGTAAFTPAQLALIEAGASAAEVAAAGATAGGLLTGAKTAAELATEKAAADAAAKVTGSLTAEELAKKAATSVLVNEVTKKVGDTASGLLQTGGSLLQSKESKEAAQKAASDIAKATQTAQEAAQFRPVGMTTRFGTSNYTYDPVTGRMISAGYQLSPEAKNAQDRLVGLAGRGLTQAEQAQQQFAPLQTGAQNLFGLGNQYISQSPQDVAQNYLNQQMALLQPGRELELANLQNRLQQQGRAGLSVAQGGTLGATTPELQALYNARAQQEAQLAANAQQFGQQNTLFGVNLLNQGAQAMGNYYGGQQAAYAPYTTALGQIQNLETAAQQPLQMGANLAQQASAAGARSGALGLEGTNIASKYLTGNDATFNPYASLFTAAGNPNSMFGQSIAKYLSGQATTPYDALSSTKYGDGLAGYEKMIADIYGS